MYVISMFLFGIDEIAMQCEEPFTILPQQEYCDEIYNDCIEIANFDYNHDTNATLPLTTIASAISDENSNIDIHEISSGSTIDTVTTEQQQQQGHYTNTAEQQIMFGHTQR